MSIRIDPAYYITIILTILLFKILHFVPGFKGESITFIPGQFFAHLFYLVPFTKYPFYIHVFWTLCLEFQFYLLIGLFYFLYNNILYQKVFLILFSLTWLIPLENSYYILPTYAPIFAFGVALNDYYRAQKWQNTLLPVIFLGFIAVKFGIAIFGLLTVTAIIIISVKVVIKPLALLGEISYSLYLTHPLTLIIVSGTLKRANFIIQNQLLSLSINVFIAVYVSYIFYMLIEKPSLRLSKQIFYSKPSGIKPIERYIDSNQA